MTNIPHGCTIERSGDYLRIIGLADHPLADGRGRIPLHRWVLYESIGGNPTHSSCKWCGHVLPWKSNLLAPQVLVINADHVDGDKNNNDASNLVTSCAWCNVNRNWAEKHPKFWSDWRRWMADVPPNLRPNLSTIAAEFGIGPFGVQNGVQNAVVQNFGRVSSASVQTPYPLRDRDISLDTLAIPPSPFNKKRERFGHLVTLSDRIAHSNLSLFLEAIPSDGEGLRLICHRLQLWVSECLGVDASMGCCRKIILRLLEIKKIVRLSELYFMADNAPAT